MKNGFVIFHLLWTMQKLNELNAKLQGKGLFAHELYQKVKAFQSKLKLFAKQLNEQNFVHFPVENTSCLHKLYQASTVPS